jgi:polyhydroxybutyrate depolymerase
MSSTDELMVAGVRRTFRLHVGRLDPGRPAPLLLCLHGGGSQGASQERYSGFDGVADRLGMIVAYPDGLKRHWEDGRGGALNGQHDLEFMAAVIERVAAHYAVDRSRIFATGISNGGFFALRLACEMSDQIAAVASVSATLPNDPSRPCAPHRPVSVLMMNGTGDPIVPFEGGRVAAGAGGPILSTKASIASWVRLDRCGDPPVIAPLPPLTASDPTRVIRTDYSPCAAGSEVVLYTIEGGGHAWPGRVQYLPQRFIGRASQNLDATGTIADFLMRHRLAPH